MNRIICGAALAAAVMTACGANAARVPERFDYDGPLAEAAVAKECAFATPDGTAVLTLTPVAFKPGKLTVTAKDGKKTSVATPEGMVGRDPVAKMLGDGRVMITFTDTSNCDTKVYGYRACAWIGPWASLKAGSVRGFYRVAFSRPGAAGAWFPDAAAADKLFLPFAKGNATGEGPWDRPVEVDITGDLSHYAVVNESDLYDAHATSVMLPDEKTLYCFWDLAHGGPTGPAALSKDGGRTWKRIDERIPAAFKRLHDAPVAFRFTDPKTGKARIRVFAGYDALAGDGGAEGCRGPKDRPLEEAMPSILSEDDGETWKFLPGMGADFRCVISFFGMERLKDGSYFGVYHRGPQPNGAGSPLEIMGTISRDGGMTWEKPFLIARDERYDLCEPAVFYSPDRSELCMLIRENKGAGPSQMCFSKDEGRTWTKIVNAPLAMNGHRHVVQRLPDGRYLVVFRRVDWSCPHVFGWVGPYEGIRDGSGRGGYVVRLVPNYGSPFDCGYQGMHLKKDGEIVINTYSHFRPWANATPSIVSAHFKIAEADALVPVERAYWADQLAAIDEAKKGVVPDKAKLAACASQQRDWEPFPGKGFEVLRKAKVYGFVKRGAKVSLDLLKYLPSRDVYDGRGVVDVARWTGVTLDVQPWMEPPYAAYVVWEVASKEDVVRAIRIKNDYFTNVFVNGRQLPSTRGGNGALGFGPIYGNWTEGVRYEVPLKKGKNEIVLLTSPGSNCGGQWICAAALEAAAFGLDAAEKKEAQAGEAEDLAALRAAVAEDMTHEVRPGGVKGNRVYPERGVYFATHFGNWYEKATEAEIADYVRELKRWGCNSLSAWFDIHDYTGMDDPKAAARLKLVRTIFRSAKANGLKTGMATLANEAFRSSPEALRADWRAGKNGYTRDLIGHYHVEICPSKPGGLEQILKTRREVFAAFADLPPDCVSIGPYDQGGCTCDKCAPWGVNGYLRSGREVAALARKTFPGVRICLSVWRFDAFGPELGEWKGLVERQSEVRTWADVLSIDACQLGWLEKDPILPYVPMTEISMDGMLPWGGFGANPRPAMLENLIRQHPKVAGTGPYSEGLYEDMNKVIGLALLSGRVATAREGVGLYAARYFGEATAPSVVEAADLLEANLGHDAYVVQNGRRNDFYSLDRVDPAKPWQLEIRTRRLDAKRAARALALLTEAEGKMTEAARKSWRWRILKLRAEIDVELSKGATPETLAPKFDELAVIYRVGRDTAQCLVPPTRKYLHPGPEVLRNGAL